MPETVKDESVRVGRIDLAKKDSHDLIMEIMVKAFPMIVLSSKEEEDAIWLYAKPDDNVFIMTEDIRKQIQSYFFGVRDTLKKFGKY